MCAYKCVCVLMGLWSSCVLHRHREKVILSIFHWNKFHFSLWVMRKLMRFRLNVCEKGIFMCVYCETNEVHTLAGEGGSKAGAPCKLLLWIQCVFMTDDGQTPPDNNWHVCKWSLTGDTKPIRPICHIQTSQHGAHTHTHTHISSHVFRLCAFN